jgi:hypothetical protein
MRELPQKLYKYKPILKDADLLDLNGELKKDPSGKIIDNGLDAITKGSIWFSKPAALNDPFDCQLKLNIDNQYFESLPLYVNSLGLNQNNAGQFANIIQYGKAQGWNDIQTIAYIESQLQQQGLPTLKQSLQAYKTKLESTNANIGVLSLAERNNNLLMWAHYAGFHTGYCLEFDTQDEEYENILNKSSFTRPVCYGSIYPSLMDLNPFSASQQDLIDNLLCYKSKEWEYEGEWRCLQQNGDKLYPFPGKLTGIIFGAKCSDVAQTALIKAVAKLNLPYTVNLYYSIIRENRFAVEVVKI